VDQGHLLQSDGEIDEFRVWNVERTASEITSNMNTSLSGSETGLVAYYNFESASGSTLLDLAGSNNGSISGATWVSGFGASGIACSTNLDTVSVTINSPSPSTD
jgi:hypothetical protein